ncbi:MAG: hypothetical protein ACLP4V_04250 [Methylocella sp.]
MLQASTRFIAYGERAGASGGGAEEGGLAPVADASRLDISVEIGFQIVMRRHLMALAAFLMQADAPALALGVVVLDAHGDDGADAGKGERHHRNQLSIPHVRSHFGVIIQFS